MFVGATGGEFGGVCGELVGAYTLTGQHAALVSNRFSYICGLEGPSMTIDTACSASLVALDVANQNLQQAVCTAAVVAGVNTLLSGDGFLGGCMARMLSPDARCKTYDAAAGACWPSLSLLRLPSAFYCA